MNSAFSFCKLPIKQSIQRRNSLGMCWLFRLCFFICAMLPVCLWRTLQACTAKRLFEHCRCRSRLALSRQFAGGCYCRPFLATDQVIFCSRLNPHKVFQIFFVCKGPSPTKIPLPTNRLLRAEWLHQQARQAAVICLPASSGGQARRPRLWRQRYYVRLCAGCLCLQPGPRQWCRGGRAR